MKESVNDERERTEGNIEGKSKGEKKIKKSLSALMRPEGGLK